MIGAGLGGPRKVKAVDQDKAYLSRFGRGKPEPVVIGGKSGPDSGEQKRLDELNAALESGLKPSGSGNGSLDDELDGMLISNPNVRKLDGRGEEVVITAPAREPEPTEEELKEKYRGGSFYPVARSGKPK